MLKKTLRLLPDVPLGEGDKDIKDGLRFEQYADILARAALDTPEPFTIGIYGGWGSGKTSMMRLVMEVVEKERNAIPVWFNAWRYEKEDHLIVPLLATIITSMHNRESKIEETLKTGLTKIRDALRSILYGVSVSGKIGIPGLSEAELSISPKDMVERYEKLSQLATERILDQSLYFNSFGKLDEIAQTGNTPKIIIFVDDLDRCFPDKAVALLEGIKLVLNQPNITFVLGIAPDIIRAYLQAKYRRDFRVPARLYEDYLDKLVQLPFPIPEIKQEVADYVRSLLKRKDVFGNISAKDFKEQYEPLITICGPACKDNPRTIIRFLNRLLILTRANEQKRNKLKSKIAPISLVHFGITQALQMKWQSVLDACELNRDIHINDTAIVKIPLCDLLAKIFQEKLPNSQLRDRLEVYSKDISNPERYIFDIIASDESLCNLLQSKPGIEWLTKPKLRKEAVLTTEQVKANVKIEESNKQYKGTLVEGPSWLPVWPEINGYILKPDANLQGANLQGAFIYRANLQGANLQGANLQRTFISKVNLQGANLTNSNLQEANLDNANLEGANLTSSNLKEAKLDNANLKGAILLNANLQKTSLISVNLQEAILQGANLLYVDLRMADLQGAILKDADIKGSHLQRAFLSGANLQGANLEGANLQGANLCAAKLQGTSLSKAILQGVKLQEAIYNEKTIWPEGFVAIKEGAINIDEKHETTDTEPLSKNGQDSDKAGL